MRLYPPIHALGRQLTEDTIFSHRFNDNKEITLKKGLNIGISVFALHRNPHVWENPEVSVLCSNDSECCRLYFAELCCCIIGARTD